MKKLVESILEPIFVFLIWFFDLMRKRAKLWFFSLYLVFTIAIFYTSKVPSQRFQFSASFSYLIVGLVIGIFLALYLFIEIRDEILIRQTDTLDKIRMMHWADFEKLVAAVFANSGYHVVLTGGNKPDGGIDIIVEKDGDKHAIQCKHWNDKHVGEPEVRNLLGALTDSNIKNGIFVCSGDYTEQAESLAIKHNIKLINGVKFHQLIKDIRKYEKIHSDSAGDTFTRLVGNITPNSINTPPSCQLCRSEMEPKFNPYQKRWFWGCSTYDKTKKNSCGYTQTLSPAEKKLVIYITRPNS